MLQIVVISYLASVHKPADNRSMNYIVGQHIDLTYLNKKREVTVRQPKKSIEAASRTLYEVGTKIVFQLTPQGFKASIKVPVAFA